jgi:hypothetical protein
MKLCEIKDISGKNISDKDISNRQELIKKLNIDKDKKAIEALYKLSDTELKTIIKLLGKHDFADISGINKKELEKGIKVEMEHSDNLLMARFVAIDHLFELPDYYSRLEKMEKEK